MPACPSCGEDNTFRARFCQGCGRALGEAETRRSRRTVTVVFADIAGSTALGERLDPEALGAVMSRYYAAMSGVVRRHGGEVEKFIGDAVMAVFGIPVLHEDDALRAVRAASEMHAALALLNRDLDSEYGIDLAMRVAVNTGPVIIDEAAGGHPFVLGDTVNAAARLEQLAPPGQVLIGESTHALVRDAVTVAPLEAVELRGRTQAMAVFRLLEVAADPRPGPRFLDLPMVGRGAELQALERSCTRMLRDLAPELLTVIGEAGVGKSRLVAEFVAPRREEMTVVTGRCLPYGQGITFWPLREIVIQLAGLRPGATLEDSWQRIAALVGGDDGETVARQISGAIGISEPSGGSEEITWATARLLRAVAVVRPAVVIVEDVHWAEPTLVEVLQHVHANVRATALLLILTARPEVADRHPGLVRNAERCTAINLAGIGDADTVRLIHNLSAGRALAPERTEQIRLASGGNPLFVEEMSRALTESGVVDSAAIGGTAVAAPAGIRALVAARLDLLPPSARQLLSCAAVIGERFSEEDLCTLRGRPGDAIAADLGLLRARGYIHPAGEPDGPTSFRFHHLLVRDAAYDALLKEDRAALHRQVAALVASHGDAGSSEYAAIAGHHLEQACHYLDELHPSGGGPRDTAVDAARLLARAGRSALDRDDVPAARNLMRRAAALLHDDEGERFDIVIDMCDADSTSDEADALLTRALAVAAEMKDLRAAEHARVLLAESDLFGAHRRLTLEETDHRAQQAIAFFAAGEDELGQARAWRLLSSVRSVRSQIQSALDAAERVREHARRAGSRRLQDWAASAIVTSICYAPLAVSEALTRIADLLAGSADPSSSRATLLAAQGLLLARGGDTARGRELVASAVAMSEQLTRPAISAFIECEYAAPVEVLAGDASAAERILASAAGALGALGMTEWQHLAIVRRAAVLSELGRHGEAEALTGAVHQHAANLEIRYRVRCVGARAAAARGATGRAQSLAQEALTIARTSDDVEGIAECLVTLAIALRSAGDATAAHAAAREAVGLSASLGNLVKAERARQLL